MGSCSQPHKSGGLDGMRDLYVVSGPFVVEISAHRQVEKHLFRASLRKSLSFVLQAGSFRTESVVSTVHDEKCVPLTYPFFEHNTAVFPVNRIYTVLSVK